MASGEEKSSDLYAVLGLNKECTALELRDAYKKLAMRWHPDRCSASGNSKFIDEAKTKFQAIQEAYSVLSDENERFLYDVGAYASDGDDDDENGMGDFLGEMAVMMSQTKPFDDAPQRFEDLQTLFDKMFVKDMEAFNSASRGSSSHNANFNNNNNSNDSCINKRNCSEMSSGNDNNNMKFQMGCDDFQNFCVGAEGSTEASKGRGRTSSTGGGSSKRRIGRKQRFTSARIPV